MLDGRAGAAHETVGALDSLRQRQRVDRLRIVMRGQAVDLLDLEHGITLHEWDFLLHVLAVVVRLGARDAVRVDEKRAVLALADLAADLLRLFVRSSR